MCSTHQVNGISLWENFALTIFSIGSGLHIMKPIGFERNQVEIKSVFPRLNIDVLWLCLPATQTIMLQQHQD